MGCRFFDKQRIDHAGILAVRLQKYIIFMWVLSSLGMGANIYLMARYEGFDPAPFISVAIQWLVLYMGFMGAYKRNTCLLLGFFLLFMFAAIMIILGFVFFSLAGSLAMVHTCAEHADHCNVRHDTPKIVGMVTGIGFAFTLVPLILVVVGAVLSFVTRKEILKARRAIVEAEKMEEGFTLEDMKVAQPMPVAAKVIDEVQTPAMPQMPQMPQMMPIYYAYEGQEQPGAIPPMGAYSPMIYYYPVNAPTQQ